MCGLLSPRGPVSRVLPVVLVWWQVVAVVHRDFISWLQLTCGDYGVVNFIVYTAGGRAVIDKAGHLHDLGVFRQDVGSSGTLR